MDRSPGGVGDGLPSLPSGEPVLARWFVISMLVLGVAGVVVAIWAFSSIRGIELGVAERRPPGTAEVTHDRGSAVLAEDPTSATGPGCAEPIALIGDEGARAAAARALSAACQLLASGDFPAAAAGLEAWIAGDGVLRFAVFERNGVDSSARVEDGRIVIELNAKFQFQRPNASLAAPFILHELVHVGQDDWPGAPVSDAAELRAMQTQLRACGRLSGEPIPRGCHDAAELLDMADPLTGLNEAGYRAGE